MKIKNDRSERRERNISSLILILLLSGGLLLTAVTGCNRRSGPPGQRGSAREATPVPVIIEEIELRDLAEYISITGRLEGITDINLISETSGRVISLEKTLGDWIDKGEELGTLDNEVFRIRLAQAQAALSAANAAMETAVMNYRSTSQLYRVGSVSEAEYQQALYAREGATAQRDGAAAALDSAQKAYDNSRLVAPVSGYITSLNLSVGETIFPNNLIAGIVDYRQMLLKGGISEQHIVSVRKDQPVRIHYQGKEYPARVRGVGLKPLPNSASYPVEIILDNPGLELVPGMVVTASIRTNEFKDLIYVESSSIRASYDDHYVYTINEDLEAERKSVTRGRTIGQYTIIASGLETGDRVVIEGIDALQNGMIVNVRN